MINIKNRIGELRREKKLTLKKMGEYLNIRDNTLSQYETGKREPTLGITKEIADFFGVSVEYLMGTSNVRDFEIKNDNDAFSLLQKIHNNEISVFDISLRSSLDLIYWIENNAENLHNNHPDLYATAFYFVKEVLDQDKAIKHYSDFRKKENEDIDRIIRYLENYESFDSPGASPNEIYQFIQESERISYQNLDNILKTMRELPDDDGEE